MFKNKRFYVILTVSLLLVALLPLAIDWLLVGNDFPSNISNSDWVCFLGGYIGAILGCAISLIGILWTINFTREQNRADRELQIRPYFDIRYLDVEQFCHTRSWLGYVMINTWDKDGVDGTTPYSGQVGSGLLYLKNVGNGPATNISFQVEVENITCEYRTLFTNKNAMVTTNSIPSGETAELSIDITNSRQAPKKEDFNWEDGSLFPPYDVVKFKIPDNFTIRLKLIYNDLMLNQFSQELVFDAHYSMGYEKDKDAQYHCELFLKQISVPTITRPNSIKRRT